jgi:hypothetical protein
VALTRSYSWRLTSRARALSIRASILASSRIMAAGPAATGTRRLAGPRREAQDELGCETQGFVEPTINLLTGWRLK